jgi:transposase InsO family protein
MRRVYGDWKRSLLFVSPETVIKWHRDFARECWGFLSKRRNPGRPRISDELVELIHKLAVENITWGAGRIHGELMKLGFSISERTVARYLPRKPSSEKQHQSWRTFLTNQASEICSMDFFTEFSVSFRQIYGLILVEHKTRKIIHTAATYYPTREWIIQQLCNAFPGDSERRYLICDNDKKFGKYLAKEREELFQMEIKHTSFRSPWQNGICERTIGSIRREMLNHIIPLGPEHLARLLMNYRDYFNNDRTHRTLHQDTPMGRNSDEPSRKLQQKKSARMGGLHHRYYWKSVA